ncbi:MAG: Phenylalanine-tRNA ligase beta subunit [Candidatus Moranbacteria bacterium GW2011_GWC2_37_73]|nr:MAG: phenylalanyl-tRNA synthetase subunit beta, phenylalanyl-tRNA synthetase beta chain [Parcubacteria group bacterium GW2011_GWC1_36_108]KKQ00646.1 MAG: Phenylalanine-tRNA ligase beta subunit [Candidatus Moranbacteria bacterium GW2011_GWD1_36_198]KKQ01934.1 MAG: Phenylalanine-tRNA ligase beta subunit [Candidatus Moranbacteria bacterium GW2011_GWD2_36_198]KKQ39487.1 MAG: Phenylalanine-tRNA ligase beta subunit [Candidatus Moranbacteria bacterium GW2011_GWC2_37_73]HAR99794.1 phenylalanine--tRN
MKYSYNWLKELSDTKKTAAEIANLITLHSFEVESVEKVGSDFAGVVVGEILEISKHPNADKLQLTKVNIGKEVLDIVCGANNISVGDKVPVATVGSILPGNFEIKESEIRGEKSHGMLCAEDELGLGISHAGILLLDKNIEIGTQLREVFNNIDEVLDIKVLPDRAHDAVSHVAMAREVLALEGGEMDYDYDGLVLESKKAKNLKVEIENKDLCKRYIGAVLSGIQVKASPDWMRARLEACGLSAINNVVDATNYVMLELGQPLHAFDGDVIGNEIVVRTGKKDEEIVLLDDSKIKLTNDDIVIAGKNGALALAGIMGGKDSGISQHSTNIILEAANFKPLSIRKTRSRLGLFTDASSRFEKELDPNLAEKAMVRVIEILEHTAGATFEGMIDEYQEKIKPWTVELSLAYVDRLLGVAVPPKMSEKILTSLGVKAKIEKDILLAEIPTFRIDLKSQEDLIEEIGRIYGYDKVENIAPSVAVTAAKQNESRIFERALKNILTGQGFSEVYNYSFYSAKDAEFAQLGEVKHLELEMPMSPEQSQLRVSLIPNILKNVKENLKNFNEFNIFEIGKVYWSNGEVLPEEKRMLVGAMVLKKKNAKEEKMDKRHESGFFEAKAAVDHILAQLGIIDHYYDTFGGVPIETPLSLWHQSRAGEIKIQGSEKSFGYVGEINPFVLEGFDIDTRVVMFEFDMDKLSQISDDEREYTPIRKHPIVTRDISLLAQKDVRIDEILMVIQSAGKDLVLDVDLFDAIDFADDTSSFAFHIILGAQDRTLTGKEIDDVMLAITNKLEKDLDVKMRR